LQIEYFAFGPGRANFRSASFFSNRFPARPHGFVAQNRHASQLSFRKNRRFFAFLRSLAKIRLASFRKMRRLFASQRKNKPPISTDLGY
jgi:hypothetical protein